MYIKVLTYSFINLVLDYFIYYVLDLYELLQGIFLNIILFISEII